MKQEKQTVLTLKQEQKLVKSKLKVVKQDTKKIQKMLKSGGVTVDEWDRLQDLTDEDYYDYLHVLVNKNK